MKVKKVQSAGEIIARLKRAGRTDYQAFQDGVELWKRGAYGIWYAHEGRAVNWPMPSVEEFLDLITSLSAWISRHYLAAAQPTLFENYRAAIVVGPQLEALGNELRGLLDAALKNVQDHVLPKQKSKIKNASNSMKEAEKLLTDLITCHSQKSPKSLLNLVKSEGGMRKAVFDRALQNLKKKGVYTYKGYKPRPSRQN
jgi:cellobiose-specific phosphotransferase system component IIA